MLRDYIDRFYSKLYERTLDLRKNDYEKAIKLASWKHRILNLWNKIEVKEILYPDIDRKTVDVGVNYKTEVVLDLNGLNPEEISLEFIIGNQRVDGTRRELISTQEYKLEGMEGSVARYQLEVSPAQAGIFDYGIRITPQNSDIDCSKDMGLVRWIS